MASLDFYWHFIKMQTKAQLEYRGAFILMFISKIFGWGSGFIMIWILLYKFPNVGGWSSYEVLFLYAMDVTSYSIIGSFLMKPCSRLAGYIQSGEFDGVITKPVNSFTYFICKVFSTGYTGNMVLCMVVMGISIYKLQIRLNPLNTLFLITALLGGALIQGAAFLFSTIPAFWIVNNSALKGLFISDLKSFIRYPISVYNKAVQIFLTVVFPYAFINFYPAQYFLKKNDFLMFHPIFQFMTPLVGIMLFTAAYKFWHMGTNHYESTGS